MKALSLTLLLLLNVGRASAELDSCQKAVETLTGEHKLPFHFEKDPKKNPKNIPMLESAADFNTSSNPRVYRSQPSESNGGKNEDRITLEVTVADGQTSKYNVIHEHSCKYGCTRDFLAFDLAYDGNGVCHIDRAQTGQLLKNGSIFKERTLWTKATCNSIHESGSLEKFLSKYPDWEKKFSLQKGSKKNFINLLDENCRKFGIFSASPAGSAQGKLPAGATSAK